MKRKNLINLLLGLGLVLALSVGIVSSSNQALAQDPVVQREMSIQADVGTAFTYQGRLLDSGTPVNGTLDFHFTLWDASSGGSLVAEQGASGVEVNNGYFSVPLDFGGDAFKGDARYLGIDVEGTSLDPRVALTAAPYAHSLRPGASVESTGMALQLTTSATSGSALNAIASASSGNAAAVYGSSSSPAGAGLSGYNSTSGYGVYGGAAGSTGTPYGVYGLASNAGSATSYGVYGKSNSSVGTGVGGEAPMNGVFGRATSSSGYGVYGEATATSSTTYGVYGKTNSPSGHGVYGTSPSTNSIYAGVTGVNTGGGAGSGVYGYSVGGIGVNALATSGTGVYGKAGSGTGVHGTGSTRGVYGEATASTGTPYGVYGLASNAGSATSYGVYGKSNSSVGTGVGGEAPMNGVFGRATASNGWGVYGEATATSGTTYGVYGYSASGHGVHGKASPSEGYGLYSEGNAYVDGDLFWKPKTSYVAVATSAFIPELYGDIGHVEYDNEGHYLKNESSNAEWFTAPVQLPHDATVRELRVGWRDGSDEEGTLYLKRRSMFGVMQGAEIMAQVTSVGSFGLMREGVWPDDTIDNAKVDNENFTYYLEVLLPPTSDDVKLYGVVIEYEITQPY